jgi:membrane fusion protein, copper/silver efflux system
MKRQNEECKMQNEKVKSTANVHFAFCALHFAFAVLLLPMLWEGAAAAQEHAGHGPVKKAPSAAKQQQDPMPTITLSADKIQLIGVRTATAGYQVVDRQIRTVGRVEVNETKLAFVNTKISGWVKKLYIDYTGQHVKKGQPLLSLYSPDLVSAQEEYLFAFKASTSASAPGGFKEVDASRQSLLESAKRRLHLWDITDAQIEELEKTGKPGTDMTVFAPLDGIVLEKMVLDGGYITPGMNLYKIADLSTIWVIADVYEYEVPLVKVGQKARVSLSYEPGTAYSAIVNYIYPTLDPVTRTVKVRLTMENPGRMLKPEMYANIEISASSGSRLTIPTEAVLDTGVRQIVYVEKKPGVYEMREVKLGARGEKYVEVLSGIRKGERVVTSGNFLIDSESQLRQGPGEGHQH